MDTQAIENALSSVLAFVVTYATVIAILSIILYVFHGIGLCIIANKCSLWGWLAWIPIARLFLLVEVADVARQRLKKEKKLIMWYTILFLLVIASIVGAIGTMNAALLILVIISVLCCRIVEIFAYYYIYRASDPVNSVIYFILGYFIKPLNSVFLICCAKEA